MSSPEAWLVKVFWFGIISTAYSQRPNIVFIIADDLGWNDVGFHDSEIETPNIDALAYDGIILNKYYVSPICSPTRSAIMTGRHPIHTGMQVYVIGGATPYGLPLSEITIAQHLQKLGYRRHLVGKWHLGFFTDAYLPMNRGFESHFGYYTGHEDYFDHESDDDQMWGLDFHRNGQTLWDVYGNFSTEMYTQEAERIIRSHNQSEPLFLVLAHQAVHAGNQPEPLEVPESYVERYTNKIKDVKRRMFAGMVSALDDSVGQVVKVLNETGLMKNTVLVFTTDNGGPTNGYDGNAACNWPLRGVKNTMWEGGIRGVGLISSPLLNGQSYVSENFFHVTDWLPTLYHAAGGDPTTLKNLDGLDLWDMLRKNGEQVRSEVLHNIDPVNKFASLRVGDYKLVMGKISVNDNGWYPPPQLSPKKNSDILKRSKVPIVVKCGPKPLNASYNCLPEVSPCLFHIPMDPCEYENIADVYPDIVKQMLQRLEEYNSTMIPPANKPVDPNANPALHGGDWKPWM